MEKDLLPKINQQWWNESAPTGFRFKMKPYYFKELCELYGLKYRPMCRAIAPIRAEIGEIQGYYWNVRQVEKVLLFMGPPYILEESGSG